MSDYQMFIVPIVASVLAQLLKFVVPGNKLKVTWRNLSAYSGMPSSHSAFVGSLVASIGLVAGINSAAFAVAVVFAIIVIRDAVGLRRKVGLGHTPLQVVVGAVLGVVISVVWYWLV